MKTRQPNSVVALKKAVVLYHPLVERSKGLAENITAWLNAQGIESWKALTWSKEGPDPHLDDTDVLIVLGGDGSMLRAARLSVGRDSLILGINLGKVGFLSEMGPENWPERLPGVLAGDYWIEERMMITSQTYRGDDKIAQYDALNDVVVSRGSLSRVVRLTADVDGDPLTTYVSDGLIISTPTGSTAYALAAGGPILPPELRNILVIPIAAHLTLDRPIVLSQGATVGVRVSTDHQAILTVDGQLELQLQDGDYVKVSACEHSSRFIRLGKRSYFYDRLLKRLEPKFDVSIRE